MATTAIQLTLVPLTVFLLLVSVGLGIEARAIVVIPSAAVIAVFISAWLRLIVRDGERGPLR